MKILITEYDPSWPDQFEQIKKDLTSILKPFHSQIEHVGSTSVPGLAAKPIIDILVGIKNHEDLDSTVELMINHHYIYYRLFNSSMPERRLFVGLKDPRDSQDFQQIYSEGDHIPHEAINLLRLCHVHIWQYGTHHWIRHLAFREYLKSHPSLQNDYTRLKKQLSMQSWKNGMEYNNAKTHFVRKVEKEALKWYRSL